MEVKGYAPDGGEHTPEALLPAMGSSLRQGEVRLE
jgi:hypothetical protein